jgi:uncharacterized delta-60 repeat protein
VKLSNGQLDDNQFFVLKLDKNGKVLKSFGGNNTGVASYNIDASQINAGGDQAAAMTVQWDGKILVAGQSDRHMAVFRFNADGSRDWGFGSGGAVRTGYVANEVWSVANGVGVGQDGKIVLGGDAFNSKSGGHQWALARLTKDGKFDNSFDYDGTKYMDVNNGNDMIKAWSCRTTADRRRRTRRDRRGQPVRAGSLQHNGKLDPSFGGFGGFTATGFGGANIVDVTAMCKTPDGRIMLAGDRWNSNGGYDIAMAKFVGHAPTFKIMAVQTGKEGSGKNPAFKITRDGDPYDGTYDLNLVFSGTAINGQDYTVPFPASCTGWRPDDPHHRAAGDR